MDLLREIVGGPKHRFKENGYNLDLTYITDRVIAMAFPASGIEKLYRNSVDVIAYFLEERHPKSSLIINISGRDVDIQKLGNVEAYDWEDHCAPAIEVLFVITHRMYSFLSSKPPSILENQKNVVVVHCNHGKGRTGTIICCFLLYCGLMKSPELAMEYYARKRFEQRGMGVTQPCQIRYVHYFHEILTGAMRSPSVVSLDRVVLTGDYRISKPYVKLKEIRSGKQVVTSKSSTNQIENIKFEKTKETLIKLRQPVFFAGDMMLLLNNEGFIGAKKVGRLCFSTAFIPEDNKLTFRLSEMSPDSLMKSEIFAPNFTITLFFDVICKCPNNIAMHLRCPKCREKLVYYEEAWGKIARVLEHKPYLKTEEAKILLFGEPKNCDIEEFIKKYEQERI